ncbi:MAG: AMP-binding protein, partial [Clostridia bacterium]|nr:AMP-binding protein [Clostridia bacterium]
MEMIEKTLGDVIRDLAKKYPDKQAIKYTTNPYERTWREFDEETDKVAKGLMAIGVKKGDKVAIWANNIPEWLLTLFGAAKCGAVLVTVNTNYKVFELEYLLTQSDTKVLVMMGGFKNANYVEIVRTLVPEIKDAKDGEVNPKNIPFLKRIVFAGESTPDGMMNFNSLIKKSVEVSDEEFAKRTAELDTH